MAKKRKFYYRIEGEFHQRKYDPFEFQFYAETHRTLESLGIADILDILTQISPKDSIGAHEVKGWLFEPVSKKEFKSQEKTFLIPVPQSK